MDLHRQNERSLHSRASWRAGRRNAVKGFADYSPGKAKTISGIKTPNDSTIVFTLTHPSGDFPNGNTNYSLVGLTPALATKVDVKGSVTGVPSVDSQLDKCAALLGQPRQSCYENSTST